MLDKTHFHFTGICGKALKNRGFTVTSPDPSVYPPIV
jgi:hypothetical protein